MSVMKAIQQMQDECDMMRASGAFTDKEIANIVDDFCESYNFPKPSVMSIVSEFEEETYENTSSAVSDNRLSAIEIV